MTPEGTTKESSAPEIDWQSIPSVASSPTHRWFRALLLALIAIVAVTILPAIVGLGHKWGWWESVSLLKISTESQQVVSIVGGIDSGALMTVDHRGVREIILLISDTLYIEQLSQGVANNSQPKTSPQGDRVAFVVGEPGARKIKIARIQGYTYVLTDDKKINEAAPSEELKGSSICDDSGLNWSPDGTYLAFMACVEDKSAIVTVDTQTNEVGFVPRTDSASKRLRSFAWLGDDRIVFVEEASPDADQVFVITVDGSDKTLVLSGP